jgi:hypothetical protein
MLMMQKTSTDIMCYYDARIGHGACGGMFNPDTTAPYRNYYSFAMFNSLYQLKNQVETECDNEKVFVGAAIDGKKAAIVISNVSGLPLSVELSVLGFSTKDVQVLRVDDCNRYTLTGQNIDSGFISIPENGCVEIKLWNLD